jgi:hypothetical protein
MSNKQFLQVLAIIVFAAFFAITFSGYFLTPTDVVNTGATVFGEVFQKIVEFFTLAE